MFIITLTRQQRYELYYEGPEATIYLIESLLEELADFERLLAERQRRVIDAQHERNQRQAARLKRLKEELERQQSMHFQLTRRLRELQAELERYEIGEVWRDSHNSSLSPALDPPGVKARNAVRSTRSLRRRAGRRVGAQPGRRGTTLVRVEVAEHRAETRRCSACGERTKAVFPRGVRAPVQYGERVRARATCLHQYQLLPFARTAEAGSQLN